MAYLPSNGNYRKEFTLADWQWVESSGCTTVIGPDHQCMQQGMVGFSVLCLYHPLLASVFRYQPAQKVIAGFVSAARPASYPFRFVLWPHTTISLPEYSPLVSWSSRNQSSPS